MWGDDLSAMNPLCVASSAIAVRRVACLEVKAYPLSPQTASGLRHNLKVRA